MFTIITKKVCTCGYLISSEEDERKHMAEHYRSYFTKYADFFDVWKMIENAD